MEFRNIKIEINKNQNILLQFLLIIRFEHTEIPIIIDFYYKTNICIFKKMINTFLWIFLIKLTYNEY